MFPFTLSAIETPHYTQSPHEFRTAFLANRPAGPAWYAYYVTVKSPTVVEFTAYDMRDMCYGGIGEKIGTFEAVVDAAITRPAIERRARRIAEIRRLDELEAAESAIIEGYAAEVLAEIYPTHPTQQPE